MLHVKLKLNVLEKSNASKSRLHLIVFFFKEFKNVVREGDACLGFMIITHGLYCSFCFPTEHPHHIYQQASRGRLVAPSCFDNNLS